MTTAKQRIAAEWDRFKAQVDAEVDGWLAYHLPGQHDQDKNQNQRPARAYAHRDLSPAEKRVDFAAIDRLYRTETIEAAKALKALIKPLETETLRLVERTAASGGLSAQFIGSLRLQTSPQLTRVLQEYLAKVWRTGRDKGMAELPESLRRQLRGVALYHLAGKHDQCDHSETGECSVEPWVGVKEDDLEGDAPDVNWYDRDLQDSGKVTRESILATYGNPKAKTVPVVYQRYIDLNDLDEKLVEEEDADDVDPAGYDWSEFDRRGTFPPIKVDVGADSKPNIIDGNHRVRFWRETGFEYAPAWVLDYRESSGAQRKKKRNSLQDLYRQYECAYCGLKRYHLPGQHDQCDHSPTGDCVDEEWSDTLGKAAGAAPVELRKEIEDPDSDKFHYHATNIENAWDIAGSKLDTHRPDYGTDQDAWPDGSRERRSYFGTPKNVWQFAPEHGKPVVLRVGRDAADFKRESTGDIYTTKPVASKQIQILTDKGWLPLNAVLRKDKKQDQQPAHEYAAAFVPDKALDFLLTKAIQIKGVIDRAIEEAVKYDLFEHLKGGRPLQETMQNLHNLFKPYVGDPEMIEPSGLTQTPEDILQAYRLELIVRNETNTALNMGRRAVGDAAEDYVLGYEISAILDLRTTETCATADGLKFRADDAKGIKLTPPLHWNCRSILAFVTRGDLPVNWSSDAELDSVIRLMPRQFK